MTVFSKKYRDCPTFCPKLVLEASLLLIRHFFLHSLRKPSLFCCPVWYHVINEPFHNRIYLRLFLVCTVGLLNLIPFRFSNHIQNLDSTIHRNTAQWKIWLWLLYFLNHYSPLNNVPPWIVSPFFFTNLVHKKGRIQIFVLLKSLV